MPEVTEKKITLIDAINAPIALCCVRRGMKNELDIEKVALANTLFPFFNSIEAGAFIRNYSSVEQIREHIEHISVNNYNYVYFICCKILAAKGFEDDITVLADLAPIMKISQDEALMLIEMAKSWYELSKQVGIK